jgi:hypothetical protein
MMEGQIPQGFEVFRLTKKSVQVRVCARGGGSRWVTNVLRGGTGAASPFIYAQSCITTSSLARKSIAPPTKVLPFLLQVHLSYQLQKRTPSTELFTAPESLPANGFRLWYSSKSASPGEFVQTNDLPEAHS